MVDSFKPNGFQLAHLKEVAWLDGTLTGYDIIKTQPVLSLKTISEPLYKDYQLIFIKGEDGSIEKINKIIKSSDGALGRYQIFDCGDDTYLISTKEPFKKTYVDELFAKLNHQVIRYGHELNRVLDLKLLVAYLKTVDVFDKDGFTEFEKNELSKSAHQIRDQYQPNKISIRVIASSLEAKKCGYLIEDTTDLSRLGLVGKKKSLQALLKTVNEYHNDFIYLKLSDEALIIDGKLNNTLLKMVFELLDTYSNIVLIISANLASLIQNKRAGLAKRLMVEFNQNVLLELTLSTSVGGLFIQKEVIDELASNKVVLDSLLQFLVGLTPIVLIEIDPNDITKYHLEHLMLVGF